MSYIKDDASDMSNIDYLEAFTKYQEYVAHPAAFAPHLCEPDRSIEDAENMLKKDCKTVLHHFQVVEARLFLSWLLMTKVVEHGKHVYLECIHRKVELDKQDPCVTIPSRFPASIDGEPAPLFDYPNTIPARTFKSEEVMNLPCVPIQEVELMQYQRRPELLQKETFVSYNEHDEEYEVFRIPAFVTIDQERIFYMVYADLPEAFAITSTHLFEDLHTSERVLSN
ncbi:hypothetical protein F5887DRAFT_1078345 [Amanita rubescens]|nr:hypothetical protein F5887DRAFT_1078345 [Amanita rubescens]